MRITKAGKLERHRISFIHRAKEDPNEDYTLFSMDDGNALTHNDLTQLAKSLKGNDCIIVKTDG